MLRLPLRLLLLPLIALLALPAPGKPAEWRKISTPAFTVYTTMDQKKAVAWAGDLSQFIATLQTLIPADTTRLPRLTIVLFPRERDFVPYRLIGEDGKPVEVDGFFARLDGWAVAGLSADGLEGETRRTFFHEGTHWYLSAFDVPNPIWLEEGLAEVFSTFEIEGSKVVWGRAIDEHAYALSSLRLLPVEELLALQQSDLFKPGGKGELKTALAYAESWAFVHYLVFGKTKMPPGALTKYVELAGQMAPARAFETAFGISYSDMDFRLLDYVRGGTYYISRRPKAELPPPTVEPARPQDVEDALARLALAGGRYDKATEHLERVQGIAPADPRPYDLLGRIRQQKDDRAGAVEAFRQAIAKNSSDFRSYLTLAALAHEDLENGKLGTGTVAAQARAIANDYERAINLNPRFEASYVGLAAILDYVDKPNVEDGGFLRVGSRLYPRNTVLRVGAAAVEGKAGRVEEGLLMLQEVLASEQVDANARQYAQKIKAELEPKGVRARAEALMKRGQFEAALKIVDDEMSVATRPGLRKWLTDVRAQVAAMGRLNEARDAIRNARWAEARTILKELVGGETPANAQTEAKRLVGLLDERGLGKDAVVSENTKPAEAAKSVPE